MTLTKQTCTRCNGSGNYSFNLRDGTVCYGCTGSGSVMVDTVKQAKAKARRDQQAVKHAARRELVLAASAATIARLNVEYGPFDVSTPLGLDQLNQAVARATRKTIWVHRDEYLKQPA